MKKTKIPREIPSNHRENMQMSHTKTPASIIHLIFETDLRHPQTEIRRGKKQSYSIHVRKDLITSLWHQSINEEDR